EQCQQKRLDIQQMERQSQAIGQEIGRIDVQIRQLQQQRNQKVREKQQLDRKIRIDRAMMERSCRFLRECERLEKKVQQLKQRIRPMLDRSRALRADLDRYRSEADRIDGRINRVSSAYRQLNCDNLVAGQTAQSTIDRCSQLFSEWNALQKELNSLQDSIRGLKGRFQRLMKEIRRFKKRIAQLLGKMRRNCTHSSALAELERLDNDWRTWESWGRQIGDLNKRLTRFRALRIVRPRVAPPPRKPKLKPVKKPKLKKVR
ncbi:MAG: hypothetical protein D6806_05030, partial [Deltaproteobacteria bacterium]